VSTKSGKEEYKATELKQTTSKVAIEAGGSTEF